MTKRRPEGGATGGANVGVGLVGRDGDGLLGFFAIRGWFAGSAPLDARSGSFLRRSDRREFGGSENELVGCGGGACATVDESRKGVP